MSTDRPDAECTPPMRLTSFSHGGGCGKIAPGVLFEILRSSTGLTVVA